MEKINTPKVQYSNTPAGNSWKAKSQAKQL